MALMALGFGGCGSVKNNNPDAAIDMSISKQLGDSCGSSSDCASKFCVDGVCCDAACTGTCMACNVSGKAGSCSPIPSGSDPKMQCTGMMSPNMGAPDPDAGVMFPDGGALSQMSTACAGTCNGSGACSFPDKTKSCGSAFCNDSTTVAGFFCDSMGGCSVQENKCSTYSCGSGACKTSCTKASDCLPAFYCDGATSTCKPKKDLGISCGGPSECTTGYCYGDGTAGTQKVCCNSDCAAIPGGNCNATAANAGKCQCVVGGNACASSCSIYYKDTDGDGYGDKNDTGTVGCDATPPAGKVKNNHTDCDDAKKFAHPDPRNPGDPSYYTAVDGKIANGTYDYNCDGVETKEYAEYPGSTGCGVCGAPSGTSCAAPAACGASTSGTHLACVYESQCGFLGGSPGCSCGLFLCLIGHPCPPPFGYGFAGAPGCGGFGTLHWCGACSGGSPTEASGYPTGSYQGCI
jgi:hypothetical protein